MKKILYIIVALLVVAGIIWLIVTPGKPSKYDDFAKCIKDSGAIFWGAFWCPHCQKQKAMFGSAQKLLPYVECSNPDGASQNQVCNDAKVSGYPTWVFPNGTRLTGEQTFEDLAKNSSCVLPQ